MLELIEDIKRALNSNCLKVSLGMALTLPDICGQIEFPKETTRKRYVKWCDAYLFNQGFVSGDLEKRVISGEMCYKLRCAYLHSGNLELKQKDTDDFPEFHLLLCSKEDNGIYYEPLYKDLEGKNWMVKVDVRHLTEVLCNAATEYYEQHNNKSNFLNHHIVIEDVEEKAEKTIKTKKKISETLASKKDIRNPNELTDEARQILKLLGEDPKKVSEMLNSDNEDEQENTLCAVYELIYGGFLQYQER